MRRVVIIGGSGGAKWATDVFTEDHIEVIGYMENFTKSWNHFPYPNLLGDYHNNAGILKLPETDYFVATGDNPERQKITEELVDLTGKFPIKACHPRASVSRFSFSHPGTIFGANSVVEVSVTVGLGVIVNDGAVVSHDSDILDYAQIGPGSVLCGYVQVGPLAFIGAGVTVIPKVEIGEGAIVAAGAVVTKDVEPYTMVAGVPAVIKKRLK